AAACRATFDDAVSSTGHCPMVREAKEVERRSLPDLREGGPTEVDKPCLHRVEPEVETAKAFVDHSHHAPSVVFVRESKHGVVCETDHERAAFHPRDHFRCKPPVEHYVEEDVRKER